MQIGPLFAVLRPPARPHREGSTRLDDKKLDRQRLASEVAHFHHLLHHPRPRVKTRTQKSWRLSAGETYVAEMQACPALRRGV